MGCASSTPMVATAGSEMLKAATHVAGDVKKQGEAAVEGAAETLGATIDTAKETVSTAVAGITNELGSAFKDGTEALDEAKHKVLEGLHLESKKEAETEPTEVLSTSRAPTPALEADADSLKTSTPEPEIERALANSSANEEEGPPTPKPSLQELAQLSAQVGGDATAAAMDATVAAAAPAAEAAVATATQAPATGVESRWYRRVEQEEEQRRPSTTEWEKLADQLAKSRKFKPYESFAHSQNHFSVYKDYTSLRDKPGHYDGHFSDGNSLSSASQSQSDLSSGHLTPALTRRGHRDYAKFVGSEQPASVSRASSRLSNVGGVRTFDFNPQRDRISLPISTRVGSRVGSARRSLWARGKPEVLPEEPPSFSPLRRSSMTTTLPPRVIRDPIHLLGARSTSNLATSSMPLHKKRDNFRQSNENISKKHLPDSRRGSETTAFKAMEPSPKPLKRVQATPSRRGSQTVFKAMEPSPKPLKRVQETAKESKHRIYSGKQEKSELSETFKSMLDSSRDISSALLVATPLKTASMLHSPSKDTGPSLNKMATPLGSRASTFISEATETRSNSKSLQTPSRLNTGQSPAAARGVSRELSQQNLPKTILNTTPRKIISGQFTPSRIKPNAEQSFNKTASFRQSPSASRASSRLSSNSSTEIIIRPLSHLNTPSAMSLSPDQVVMTEYEDADLEAALARLADWRGSTTTLHSMRSTSSRIGRNSQSSSLLDSRRTSPWIRRKLEHNHKHTKDNKAFSSCGILELSSPTESGQKQLERCEICCNEIVMN